MNHSRNHVLGKGWVVDPVERKSVVREFADTRWDWLRGARGLRILVTLSILVLFVAPVVVWFVEDSLGLVPLAFVATVYLTWFALRRAVRLVADAPDEALDERLITIRNQAYLTAYRALAAVIGIAASTLLLWSIVEIWSGTQVAQLSLTWPQVNALVWFALAQALLLPSLSLAIAINRRKVRL